MKAHSVAETAATWTREDQKTRKAARRGKSKHDQSVVCRRFHLLGEAPGKISDTPHQECSNTYGDCGIWKGEKQDPLTQRRTLLISRSSLEGKSKQAGWGFLTIPYWKLLEWLATALKFTPNF